MSKLVKGLLLAVALFALAGSAVVVDVRSEDGGGTQNCTWGQVKCCAAHQCTNECCPLPKDGG
jgi:hypothetical protein